MIIIVEEVGAVRVQIDADMLAEVPPQRLKGKKYLKTSLVIVDEVGFQTLSRQEASLFVRLVSYRYQRGSTIITTNKPVKDWPEVIAGDEVKERRWAGCFGPGISSLTGDIS